MIGYQGWKPEHYENIRKFLDIVEKEKNLIMSNDWRILNLGEHTRTGRKLSEAHKQKISRSLMGNTYRLGIPHPPEMRRHISNALKGKPKPYLKGRQPWNKGVSKENNEWANMMSLKLTGRKLSDQTKKKLSEAATNRWRDPDFIKAVCAKPNKSERILHRLIEMACPGQYKYVGDGSVIIDGISPDFININGQKKVIELFGEWWHTGDRVKYTPSRTAEGRVSRLKELGFDTLIVWHSELSGKAALIEKIRGFNDQNLYSNGFASRI